MAFPSSSARRFPLIDLLSERVHPKRTHPQLMYKHDESIIFQQIPPRQPLSEIQTVSTALVRAHCLGPITFFISGDHRDLQHLILGIQEVLPVAL